MTFDAWIPLVLILVVMNWLRLHRIESQLNKLLKHFEEDKPGPLGKL